MRANTSCPSSPCHIPEPNQSCSSLTARSSDGLESKRVFVDFSPCAKPGRRPKSRMNNSLHRLCYCTSEQSPSRSSWSVTCAYFQGRCRRRSRTLVYTVYPRTTHSIRNAHCIHEMLTVYPRCLLPTQKARYVYFMHICCNPVQLLYIEHHPICTV
jgi:hypothetical protein